jgi:hypothetical protein
METIAAAHQTMAAQPAARQQLAGGEQQQEQDQRPSAGQGSKLPIQPTRWMNREPPWVHYQRGSGLGSLSGLVALAVKHQVLMRFAYLNA